MSSARQALSPEDREALSFMWQEEKLARDTYLFFAERWGLRPFQQIGGRSEPRHMDAVASLMDQYGVDRPMSSDQPGVFRDPSFRELYQAMTDRGKESVIEALQVAVTIEELDISDLTDRIEATSNPQIRMVFENLRAASVHHLNAFVNQLLKRGGHHTPVYLDQETFDRLVDRGVWEEIP